MQMLPLRKQTQEESPVIDIFWLSSAMETEPILRDVFTGWESGDGIFNAMANITDQLPWAESSVIDSTVLDVAYFGNHSGGKFCAPIVKMLLDDEGNVPAAGRATIAKIIISKYLTNWQHLWETNTAAYNPIHNYDMTETRNLRKADSESESIADELSHGKVETTAHGRTSNEMDYKYGINTDTENPRPSDRIDSTEGGSTTITNSGKDLDDKQRNRVGAGEEEETINRAGNIGVTTTQRMIEEDRKLWLWNYFDQIFSDLDRELALMFHDSCRV